MELHCIGDQNLMAITVVVATQMHHGGTMHQDLQSYAPILTLKIHGQGQRTQIQDVHQIRNANDGDFSELGLMTIIELV